MSHMCRRVMKQREEIDLVKHNIILYITNPLNSRQSPLCTVDTLQHVPACLSLSTMKQWSAKDILASSLQELKTPRLQWSGELYCTPKLALRYY